MLSLATNTVTSLIFENMFGRVPKSGYPSWSVLCHLVVLWNRCGVSVSAAALPHHAAPPPHDCVPCSARRAPLPHSVYRSGSVDTEKYGVSVESPGDTTESDAKYKENASK